MLTVCTMFFNLYLCNMCVCMSIRTCVWGQVLSGLDCYSLSTLLRQGLSLNMGLRFFCLNQKLSNPSNVSVSVLLGAGLTGIHGMSSLRGGAGIPVHVLRLVQRVLLTLLGHSFSLSQSPFPRAHMARPVECLWKMHSVGVFISVFINRVC